MRVGRLTRATEANTELSAELESLSVFLLQPAASEPALVSLEVGGVISGPFSSLVTLWEALKN